MPNALVTSSERQIMEAVIPKLGMAFGATVCAEDVRESKPAPEPYLLAAELLGVDPGGCIVVEDSPNGVAAAEAAGCLVVAVPSLLPIPTQPGRVVASSLSHIDLGMLRGHDGRPVATATASRRAEPRPDGTGPRVCDDEDDPVRRPAWLAAGP
jgi:beta-phosphoglucomutase-like phosphatase (HAD superfamily)